MYWSSYGAVDDEIMHCYPGGKWEGIHDFFRCHPDILDSHDYIWLPDDDLELEPEAMDTLVSAMREHDLWLAQPALAAASQVYWPITLRCAGFRMRFTTFVELMAPCFKSTFLRSILPLFKDRRTGYGLDKYWAYWTDNPARRCAIVDSAAMTHPKRKRASGLYRTPDEAYAERAELQSHYGRPAPALLVTGAIALDGSAAVYDQALMQQVFRSGMKQLIKSENPVRIGRFLRLARELRSNTKVHDLKSIRPLPLPSGQAQSA
ncbi:MAG: DUF707 domain-containing protein [Pseudomonadota bacterium]